MARPRKDPTSVVSFRFRDDHIERWKKLASDHGMSFNEWANHAMAGIEGDVKVPVTLHLDRQVLDEIGRIAGYTNSTMEHVISKGIWMLVHEEIRQIESAKGACLYPGCAYNRVPPGELCAEHWALEGSPFLKSSAS